MVKSKLLLSCALVLAMCAFTSGTFAQITMVGPDGYMQATSVEVGIDGLGGFEGADNVVSPPPATMHPRSANNILGFVANPQLNAWAGSAYDGDFFTPGSPENGWGYEIGTTGTVAAGTIGGNNCQNLWQIPGAFTSTNIINNCLLADWEGDATSGTDLHFRINYYIGTNDLYYTTTISVTNNTSAMIPEFYYYRSLDPDNNVEVGGGFSTQNTVVDNPPSSTCGIAHVSATQTTPWNSYLGLAAIGPNWRAARGGFANRDGSDMWNGVGFFTAVGSTAFMDEGICITYKITNLAPGATEKFSFVTILDATQAANAINNALSVSFPGAPGAGSSAPPLACTSDTIQTCGAPVPITLTGPIVGDFSWAWSPTTGLTPSTGPSVTANPTVTTTYTATGTPLTACVNPISFSIVVEVTPGGGNNPVVTAVPTICVSDPPVTLTVDSTGGVWSVSPTCGGCLNTTTGVFDPLIAGPGTYTVTYTTSNTCYPSGSTTVTVAGSDPTITATTPVCAGSASFTMTSASPGGTWSATCGSCISASGVFNPTTAGTFVVSYSISGSCMAVDTQTVIVNPTVPPTTGFSYATSPVCIGGTNPVITPVAGFTTGGTFGFTPGGLSINTTTGAVNLALSTPGTYSVTYNYPATGCGPAGSSTTSLVILPLIPPVLVFNYPATSCENDTADLAPTTGTGFTTGGTFTATPSGLAIDATTGVIDVNGSTPGTYSITYSVPSSTTPCASSGSNSFIFTVNPLPNIFISESETIWIGNGALMFASTFGGSGTNSFLWNPSTYISCTTCDSTVASPPETTEYCVTVGDLGCYDTACVTVTVEIPCPTNRNMGVPNAFSPNNDGINDMFCIDGWGDCVAKFEMVIFDRWGEKVFESMDPGECWNGIYKGKVLDPAVFVYFIKATYESAGATPETLRGAFEVNKTGNISLVR